MSASAATIADLLAQRAGAHPRRPALAWADGTTWTYAELAERVDRTARALGGLGVRPGDRLAVALPDGADLAYTLLSVMSVATAAPLAPDAAAAELTDRLRGARATAVVVPDAGAPAAGPAAALDLPVIAVGGGAPALLRGASGELRGASGELRGASGELRGPPAARPAGEAPRPSDAALVLHTSGTTGRPRYVALRQSAVGRSAANIAAGLELTGHDRCLNVMPLSHAHGLFTPLLATLSSGGCVACLPGFDPAGFYAGLARFRPTWYSAVPAIHQEILAHAGRYARIAAGARLRFVRSASAALPEPVLRRLAETFGAPVIEAYGMTETASVVASNPLPPRSRKPGSVGLPVGCEIAVVDAAGEPVGAGRTGEVAVRGPAVADGYDDDRGPGGFADGWFRTGDLGRLDEDGYLFLTGRLKESINRGGRTVSPYDVEQALLGHPAVAEAVAFPVPHPSLGEDLAVAVVPAPGHRLTEQELREFAAGRLDRALMPGRVMVVAAIPRGPTGKIQRLGLHERLRPQPVEFVRAAAGRQAELAAVWAGILGRRDVGVHDNFFDLGGDSLTAVRAAEEITRRCGVPVSAVDLFAFPTVAALAGHLDAGGAGPAHGPAADDGRVRAGRARLAQRRRRGDGHG